jgi:hypothetical protein
MNIKTTYILGTFLLFNIYANAQESKLKQEKISFLGTELNYKVNAEASKNGSVFLTDSKTKNILIKGTYRNNEPSGTWYFYNPNGLETSYNYDQKKVLFLDTALIGKNIVSIKSNINEVIENASIPVFLYPKDLFIRTIVEEFTKVKTADSSEFHIEIVTDFSKSDKIKYSVKYFEAGKEKTQILKLSDPPLEINWIPAIYNKEFVPSEIRMKIFLTGLKFADDNSKRFRWDN